MKGTLLNCLTEDHVTYWEKENLISTLRNGETKIWKPKVEQLHTDQEIK